jgi:predicted DCC family thiol-disulfide oxidoreductase YuxK
MRPLRIVYDGDCPFCSRYVRLVRLRENFDVELIDARMQPETARRYSLDLNEGMIADVDGDVHHGSDAVWMLSLLSSDSGTMNRILAWLFSSRTVARLLYPFMRLGRRLALFSLGRRPL